MSCTVNQSNKWHTNLEVFVEEDLEYVVGEPHMFCMLLDDAFLSQECETPVFALSMNGLLRRFGHQVDIVVFDNFLHNPPGRPSTFPVLPLLGLRRPRRQFPTDDDINR